MKKMFHKKYTSELSFLIQSVISVQYVIEIAD